MVVNIQPSWEGGREGGGGREEGREKTKYLLKLFQLILQWLAFFHWFVCVQKRWESWGKATGWISV